MSLSAEALVQAIAKKPNNLAGSIFQAGATGLEGHVVRMMVQAVRDSPYIDGFFILVPK